MTARALFIADRIDTRSLETSNLMGYHPAIFKIEKNGYAVVMRYGVVVLFDVSPISEVDFIEKIRAFCRDPLAAVEIEETDILIDKEKQHGFWGNRIIISSVEIRTLQVIAEVLAKSVVLGFYETKVSTSFDYVEPIAEKLKNNRSLGPKAKELIGHIGDALLNMHKMVGRVETVEKPELLWEHPELERFYKRLEDEYEIKERHSAIERKVSLISQTAETVLDLLQAKRSLRVEWYIVALIVVEIIISVYELFFRH
jgi:uncharacterized Rmd1/YagE family protein